MVINWSGSGINRAEIDWILKEMSANNKFSIPHLNYNWESIFKVDEIVLDIEEDTCKLCVLNEENVKFVKTFVIR